jgi:hypothetical protein
VPAKPKVELSDERRKELLEKMRERRRKALKEKEEAGKTE